MNHHNNYKEEDAAKDSVRQLLADRLPWLFFGLLGGILATFIIAKYQEILSADIRLAFFIPIIVYLSSAAGNQTEVIFVRELSESKVNLLRYVAKESLVGIWLGLVLGLLLGLFALLWLKSFGIAITVGLATFINLSIAPILAVVIPNILSKEHSDPALGAGPVATIIQDIASLMVYFLIAALIII